MKFTNIPKSELSKRRSLLHKGLTSGEKNGNWKGENVGYVALHNRIKKQLVKPELCTKCLRAKKLELSNKSGKYKTSVNDWEWICRSCHEFRHGLIERGVLTKI